MRSPSSDGQFTPFSELHAIQLFKNMGSKEFSKSDTSLVKQPSACRVNRERGWCKADPFIAAQSDARCLGYSLHCHLGGSADLIPSLQLVGRSTSATKA